MSNNTDMHTATQKPARQQGIQSIEIGGAILRALITSGRPTMLKDVARLSGMPAAKAHRYLVSFQRMGLVSQDLQSARYHLGPFALTLGLSALASLDPLRLSGAILDELCDEIGMGVGLAVWGSGGATIVRYVDPGDAISVSLKVGRVLGLYDSATGRCFSAFSHQTAVQQALNAVFRQLASANGSSVAELRQAHATLMAEIRQNGIAAAGGSLMPGINGLSAPVFDYTGQMVAAITALGAAGQFEADVKGEAAKHVKAAAAKLSNLLGFNQALTTQADA